LDGIVKLAAFAPVDVGLKRADTVHDAFGVNVFFEQLSDGLTN
jgi:hypothetical protein